MKWIIAALLFLSADICLAEGKLTFRPEHTSDGVNKYSLGVSVYEKASGPLYYSGWLGFGQFDEILGSKWIKLRNSLVYKADPYKFEFGVSAATNPDTNYSQEVIYGSVNYKLW